MKNRNTIQREKIFNCINECTCHPTVEEIYEILNNEISIATIYRNVSYLTDAGKIRKIILNNKVVYDNIYKKHYHIECMKCGEVIDIDLKYVDNIDEMVAKHSGYDIKGHNILFSGVCKKCQAKNCL